MDWTNTQEDAAGVAEQIRLQALIRENPWLAGILASATGAMNSFGPPRSLTQERHQSNLRSEYPVAYRATQYGIPAGVATLGAIGGSPVVTGLGAYGVGQAAYNDPIRNKLMGDK